jgi:hypothetical protein
MADPKFVQAMMDSIKSADDLLMPVDRLMPVPPKFRNAREISARRKRKLEKRGEYCRFVRWTVNGKCRYSWGGPPSTAFNFRFGPFQSPKFNPLPVMTYKIETRCIVEGASHV